MELMDGEGNLAENRGKLKTEVNENCGIRMKKVCDSFRGEMCKLMKFR
jgi:hypothetical protein